MATKALVNARLKVKHEPAIDMAAYTISLIQATNWYNTNHSSADIKAWFVAHYKKRIDFPTSAINDFEYRIPGVLARILENGNDLAQIHIDRMESEFQRVRKLCLAVKVEPKKAEDAVPVKRGPTVQERMDDKVRDFVGEFNGLVDEFVTNGVQPNIQALIKTMNVAGPMGKKIAEKVQKPIQELQEVMVGEDKQLVEGWSNLKKTEVKRLLAVYTDLMERLQQAKVTAPKKVRKAKIIPAGILVKRLKFKQRDEALQLTSISPANIVGAGEVWVFNTKTSKLQVYYAVEGSGISVKGTSLLNFSTDKSKQKTVRKPETVHVLTNAGKRTSAQYYKALTTKEAAVNGRVNEECIILAAYK